MTLINIMRVVNVQTILTEREINELLKKTGQRNKKDALRHVVELYLSGKCEESKEVNE